MDAGEVSLMEESTQMISSLSIHWCTATAKAVCWMPPGPMCSQNCPRDGHQGYLSYPSEEPQACEAEQLAQAVLSKWGQNSKADVSDS
jgi:hypothetical protein